MPLSQLLAEKAIGHARTRLITDAFDSAWEILQKSQSRFAEPALAPASRTILAERLIETARTGALDKSDLRNEAIEYLHKNPPPD